MCGIVGYVSKKQPINQSQLDLMIAKLIHRGPDKLSTYISRNRKVGLGHTRLSILDLSDKGTQPMHKHNFSITFNGEIYNFIEIRQELIKFGYNFKSQSDTEVILSAFDKWGINCLKKLNGDFAFILYNEENQEAYAVRDRIGVKQLVYTDTGKEILFASESKALLSHPNVKNEPNFDTILSDLIFNFWGDKKETYFKNIHHLEPGTYLHIKNGTISKHIYWELKQCDFQSEIKYQNESNKLHHDLYSLFTDSVERQLISDAPLGTLLSGGLDSSLITQVASKNAKDKLHSFTLHYPDTGIEDLEKAKLLVDINKNIQHHLVDIVPEDISESAIDRISYHMEEVLLDEAYISVNKNYKAAKDNKIKVILNGQGADEIWLGYYLFYDFLRFSSHELALPNFNQYWQNKFFLNNIVDQKRISNIISANLDCNYLPYLSIEDPLNRLTAFSLNTHLQSMIMQEDRLSMAEGVECRVPFLDYRLVELSFKINSKLKILDGREKYLMRKLGESILPKAIWNRNKSIFPIPKKKDPAITTEHMVNSIKQSNIIDTIITGKFEELLVLNENKLWKLYALSRFERAFFK